MFRDVFHRMKDNTRRSLAVISTVVVAMVIAVGMADARSSETGATGTGTTTADSSTDSDTVDLTDADCVNYGELVSITDLPEGGKTYTYSLGGNLIPEQVPPAGWDPSTASSDQIRRYGLPPKPNDPVALQEWSAKVSRLEFTDGKPYPMCTGKARYESTAGND